jgi:hypothetical protein
MGLKLIYISSSQRFNYNTTNSNNFNISCADSLYGSYRLKAISLPNTIYTVDSGINNTFYMSITAGPSNVLITVPNSYLTDGTTLATVIQTAINTNATIAASGVVFTVGYDIVTSKLTITNNTNPFQLDLSNNYLAPINSIIGFSYGVYNSNTAVAPYSITSNQIVNLTRTPSIFITIQEANNYLQNVNTGMRYTFMIPNNVNSLYFIDSFFDQTGIFNQFAKELSITLRDDQNRIVDIQNVDWYMVLESIC